MNVATRRAPVTPGLSFAAAWIVVSAWLVASGWILSLFRALTPIGYAASLLLLGGLLIFCFGPRGEYALRVRRHHLRALRRHLLQPVPLIYFVVLIGSVIGGAIYHPNNYDAITYRFPRLLHWWWEHRWHWIGGWNSRMDYSGTGFEWLMAPSFVLFRTDRLFFLANIISYALLPGLTFSTYRALGISGRVAWWWMWLLPCGYCFAYQAGSIGNDSFAAIYLLASIVFAFRARETGRSTDFFLAIIAAGLLTGAKASNIPLLLPCFIALLPGLGQLLRRPLLAVGSTLAFLAVSFAPVAFENIRHTGDWTGDPTNRGRMKIDHPFDAVVANAAQIAFANFSPPVNPIAARWNDAAKRAISGPRFRHIIEHFPRFSVEAHELESEEGSALGVADTLLICLCAAIGLTSLRAIRWRTLGFAAGASSWIALAAYMMKIGSEAGPRLIAAYYPLLITPVLLMPATRRFVRTAIWRGLALLAALSVLPALLFSPARPLFPAAAAIAGLKRRYPSSTVVARAERVYAVYGERWDNLRPIRNLLPPAATTVAFAGNSDESEVSLWRPFASRRVVDANCLTATEPCRTEIAVGSESGFLERYGINTAAIIGEHHAEVIGTADLLVRASGAVDRFSVLRLPEMRLRSSQSSETAEPENR